MHTAAQLTPAGSHHGCFAIVTKAVGGAAHFIQDLSAGVLLSFTSEAPSYLSVSDLSNAVSYLPNRHASPSSTDRGVLLVPASHL
jgi:hypothetical protein